MLSNGSAYVLDCGMGVTNQFARTGTPFKVLKSIFITHHHADHNIEYGPLLIVGWIQGLPLGVRAFGPPPLRQMTDDFMRAYKQTVDFWAEDFHMKPLTSVNVEEISAADSQTTRNSPGPPLRRKSGVEAILIVETAWIGRPYLRAKTNSAAATAWNSFSWQSIRPHATPKI